MPKRIKNISPLQINRLIAIAYTLAVLYVSLVPVPESMDPGKGDKFIHFLLFFVIYLLWVRVRTVSPGKLFLALAAFGLVLEVLQGLMPVGRSFDLADWLFDLVGIGAAWFLWRAGEDR
ncbi:MAG: hypothetical protein GXO27_02180 [Chlorobi bacterium]|nr:hypothetical protein [Chlorobiota bacterium]